MHSLEERLIGDSRSHLILQLLQKTNSDPSTMTESEPVTADQWAAAEGALRTEARTEHSTPEVQQSCIPPSDSKEARPWVAQLQ